MQHANENGPKKLGPEPKWLRIVAGQVSGERRRAWKSKNNFQKQLEIDRAFGPVAC